MQNYSRPPHDLALEHLVVATASANCADKQATEHNLNEAKFYADLHMKRLNGQGQQKASVEYISQFQTHATRIANLLNSRVNKADQCSKDHSKLTEKCQDCGYMQKADRPYQQARWDVQKPKKDKRYDYRAVSDLHPDDQARASHQYGHRDIGHYEYPVDRQSGRLVVGNRAPATHITPPRASNYQEVKPEHKAGAAIRIDAPGEKHHGRLGIVHAPHPSMPGKIPVQIGPTEHHKIYLAPHQVKSSRAMNKAEKALLTLYAIRKVFLK